MTESCHLNGKIGARERCNPEPQLPKESELEAQKISAEPELQDQVHLLETRKYYDEDISANETPPLTYPVDVPEMEP